MKKGKSRKQNKRGWEDRKGKTTDFLLYCWKGEEKDPGWRKAELGGRSRQKRENAVLYITETEIIYTSCKLGTVRLSQAQSGLLGPLMSSFRHAISDIAATKVIGTAIVSSIFCYIQPEVLLSLQHFRPIITGQSNTFSAGKDMRLNKIQSYLPGILRLGRVKPEERHEKQTF